MSRIAFIYGAFGSVRPDKGVGLISAEFILIATIFAITGGITSADTAGQEIENRMAVDKVKGAIADASASYGDIESAVAELKICNLIIKRRVNKLCSGQPSGLMLTGITKKIDLRELSDNKNEIRIDQFPDDKNIVYIDWPLNINAEEKRQKLYEKFESLLSLYRVKRMSNERRLGFITEKMEYAYAKEGLSTRAYQEFCPKIHAIDAPTKLFMDFYHAEQAGEFIDVILDYKIRYCDNR